MLLLPTVIMTVLSHQQRGHRLHHLHYPDQQLRNLQVLEVSVERCLVSHVMEASQYVIRQSME